MCGVDKEQQPLLFDWTLLFPSGPPTGGFPEGPPPAVHSLLHHESQGGVQSHIITFPLRTVLPFPLSPFSLTLPPLQSSPSPSPSILPPTIPSSIIPPCTGAPSERKKHHHVVPALLRSMALSIVAVPQRAENPRNPRRRRSIARNPPHLPPLPLVRPT